MKVDPALPRSVLCNTQLPNYAEFQDLQDLQDSPANHVNPEILSKDCPYQHMIRRIIVALVRLALRIYFQRIEVTGVEHVPLDTPVIFVLNHPNALVDPVFLLCLAPRDVSFLAKAPLFRMPVIGYLVKAMDSLPVYRRQDEGEDVTKNEETFIAARKLLAKG